MLIGIDVNNYSYYLMFVVTNKKRDKVSKLNKQIYTYFTSLFIKYISRVFPTQSQASFPSHFHISTNASVPQEVIYRYAKLGNVSSVPLIFIGIST